MNPEKPSREEIEAKLTALLLGELPAEEAQLLRWAISQDAALAQLHDRLKLTVGFVREVAAHPAESTPAQTVPLKLSGEKREKLLAHFKTVLPIVFLPPLKNRRDISPFLAMAAAVALIAVLAAMLLPALAASKRKAQNISAMNEAKINEMDARLSAENTIAASPSAESERRLAGLEAHFQNGSTTAANTEVNGNLTLNFANPSQDVAKRYERDRVLNSAKIVLPSGGTEDKELAVASPAPPERPSMGSSGGAVASDQNGYTVHIENAHPTEVLEALRKTFPSGNNSPQVLSQPSLLANRPTQMNSSSSSSSGFATAQDNLALEDVTPENAQKFAAATAATVKSRGGGFGGRGGGGGGGGFGGGGRGGSSAGLVGNWQTTSTVTAAPPPLETLGLPDSAGEMKNSTVSGFVAVNDTGAQPSDGNTRFYTSAKSYSGADQKSKEPMLGDSPAAGRLFQNSPANIPGYVPGVALAGIANGAALSIAGSNFVAPQNLGEAYRRNSPSGFYDSNYSDGANRSGQVVDNNGNIALADDLSKSGTGTFGLNGNNSYNGLTKDDANGFRYLLGSNSVQIENNGTVGTAQFSLDADTHNLVVTADKETKGRINQNILDMDPNSVAPNPTLTQEMLRRYNDQQLGGEAEYSNMKMQLTELQSLQATNPAKLRDVLPTIITDGTLADLSAKLHQTEQSLASLKADFGANNSNVMRQQSLADELNRQIDARVKGIMTSLSSQEKSLKAALDMQSNLVQRTIQNEDQPLPKLPTSAPVPQPEFLTREDAFSTFSLNVSDVSFKLAAASLQKNVMPDAASIRSEEFINTFDYRDPEPLPGVPVAFVSERARDPFTQNRDLLRFSIKTAAAGREAGRPLNIVLLLDNSGSMERADRVAIIHEALKVLASELQPQDTLSIVTFARTARLWVDGARGDRAGTAVNEVSNLTPGGGTNLEEAMNLAYATARRHYLANGVNRVVLLTDGAANLGNVNPDALKQKVESFRKQGIALDCFGIGWEGYNDDLLEVLSSNGDGRYGFINTPEAATTEFAAQLAGALHVAAEDVKVQVEFNPQRVISWRQIGYAKHQLTKQQFRDNTVAAAPMAAREAGNALYTVEINPQGSGPIATVRVRFRVPGTQDVSEHEWQVPFDGNAPALENSSPAMRLASVAAEFSEWLASSPYAQEVTPDQLLNDLSGVPQIYGADPRPKQLETMIREAKSIAGQPSRPGSGGF